MEEKINTTKKKNYIFSNVNSLMFVNRIREMLGHWNAESEGLRFDSSWGLRIFFFVPFS